MNLNFIARLAGYLAAVFLLNSCRTADNSADENVKVYQVAPMMKDGVGVGPMTCLLVRKSPESDYEMFYSPIAGFDYVSGYEYLIRVHVTGRKNVPADASNLVYELVDILSRNPGELMLENRKWELAGRIDGSQVDMKLTGGLISGNGGINRFSSPYELDGASLKIGMGRSTMMAGPENLMNQEQTFLNALQETASFRIVGEELRFLDAGGKVVLRFNPSDEPILTSVKWKAVGINNGVGGVRSIIDGSEVFIIFDREGRTGGKSGCNNFNGTYMTDGSAIKFGPLGGTRKMCAMPEGIMKQEGEFLKALANAAAWSIDGKTLELRGGDGALQVRFVAGKSDGVKNDD